MAANIDPKDLRTHNNMGIAYTRRCDYAKAISAFNKAYSLAPTYYRALVNKSAVRVLMGDPEKAIRDATVAIRLNTERELAYRNRGIALELVGKKTEAASDLARTKNLPHTTALYMVTDP
jgi:tetratricopeptide (TPR) repeat protein